jgi:hypothetical protein
VTSSLADVCRREVDHTRVAGRLVIVAVTLRTASRFVAEHHRHLGPARGHRFSIGVATLDAQRRPVLHGVVVVGRPVARAFDDGATAEVTRLCTDATTNACSALLGAAWRAAKAMGHTRLITYTRADEPGTSLMAAGWWRVADRPARPGWSTPSRPRAGHGTDRVARVLWQAPGTGSARYRPPVVGEVA